MKTSLKYHSFVLIFGGVLLLSGCTKKPNRILAQEHPEISPTVNVSPAIPSNTNCINETFYIVDISPNQKVSYPLVIHGTIKTPSSKDCKRWGVFEGQAGTVEIQKNGTVLHSQPITIDGDWMTDQPVSFLVTITDKKPVYGEVNLVFKSDNPSGLPENDQVFTLPLVIEH